MTNIFKKWLGIYDLECQIKEQSYTHSRLNVQVNELTLSHIELLEDKYKNFKSTSGAMMSSCVEEEILYLEEYNRIVHTKPPRIDIKLNA